MLLLVVSTYFVLTLQLFAFSWLPQHDPAFGVLFYLQHGEARRPPDAGRKMPLCSGPPYGVRDLLRAGDVPAMLAAGYILIFKAHCSIVLDYYVTLAPLRFCLFSWCLSCIYRQDRVGYA
jgi:hypothetical protein